MTISDYLRRYYAKPLPRWLGNATPGMRFPKDDFFTSRVVYYPGSGDDGHPVKLFGSAGASHCFIYADFSYNREDLCNSLDSDPSRFRGYRSLMRLNVERSELRDRPWHPPPIVLNYGGFVEPGMQTPFALLEILERTPEFDSQHGPERLAILFVAGCGFATFDALFSQSERYVPFGIMLQDHGFGGNPDRFGMGGLLDRLARQHDKRPETLVVARNTTPWNGYKRVDGLLPEPGGMHAHPRSLYLRDKDTQDPQSKGDDTWVFE